MDEVVRLLFRELADCPPEERENVFRDRQIAPDLRAEVESLLNFDSEGEHGLTDCVSSVAAEALSSHVELRVSQCGPYRLVRLLGAGGMGSVYLAERSDGEIQQQVAVKLLHARSNRPAWRDRFLKERQLLATLNHPSIARVVDAGHAVEGQPYLVMEYVDGVPIDVYAAGKDLREQLTLFLRVCEGVSDAHRHLIIHRDLKPSNILVDASGQPKLLDFGIAKLLDETGDATQTVERLLTPNYASPEQLRGTNQTTATDVYSLGALLYKVLTGRSPHESDTRSSQAMEVITGAKRIPAPSQLNPKLPKDIDYILRKALRAEPEERYISVEAFGNDVRAFLDERPVQARSGDAWYRSRKFLRRNWLPAVAAIVTIAGLSLGLYIANRERAIAQRRFVQVRQLANKLFDIDVQARNLPGSTKVRQLIVDTSLAYLQRLAADVHGDPELALEVGNAYMRVARVQGVPISPNLGQMDQAEQNLRIAERFVHSVLVSQPANRTALLRAAQTAHDRMILARLKGHNNAEALALARQSAEWLEKFHAGKSDKPEASAVLNTYLNVADQYASARQFDDALRLCSRAIDLCRDFDSRAYHGNFLWASAHAFRELGLLDEALRDASESVSLLDPGPENVEQGPNMNFVQALTWEGRILGEDNAISLDRPEEASKILERAFSIADRFVHQDTRDQNSRGRVAVAGLALASILSHSDSLHALKIFDHTFGHIAEVGNNSSFRRFEVSALAGSSYPLRRLGRYAEARQRLDAAFERLRQQKLYPAEKIRLGSETDVAVRALADSEAEGGNLPGAIELYRKLVEQIQAEKSAPETSLSDAVCISNIYRKQAALHRQAGQADLASALEARSRDLWRQWNDKLPRNDFVRRQLEAARP